MSPTASAAGCLQQVAEGGEGEPGEDEIILKK